MWAFLTQTDCVAIWFVVTCEMKDLSLVVCLCHLCLCNPMHMRWTCTCSEYVNALHMHERLSATCHGIPDANLPLVSNITIFNLLHIYLSYWRGACKGGGGWFYLLGFWSKYFYIFLSSSPKSKNRIQMGITVHSSIQNETAMTLMY